MSLDDTLSERSDTDPAYLVTDSDQTNQESDLFNSAILSDVAKHASFVHNGVPNEYVILNGTTSEVLVTSIVTGERAS